MEAVLSKAKLLGGAAPRTILLLLCMELVTDRRDELGDGTRITGRDTVLLLANPPRFAAGVRNCKNRA